MRLLNLAQLEEWNEIIERNRNSHFVCPAWIDRRSSLYYLAIQLLGFSPSLSLGAVGGLSGKVIYPPRNNWEHLWQLCDRVNDSYETGTLLPNQKVTLLPAFTITYGYREERSRNAISDIFRAHDKFLNRETEIVVLMSWGCGLQDQLEPSILRNLEVLGSEHRLSVVMPPPQHDCHWSKKVA